MVMYVNGKIDEKIRVAMVHINAVRKNWLLDVSPSINKHIIRLIIAMVYLFTEYWVLEAVNSLFLNVDVESSEITVQRSFR